MVVIIIILCHSVGTCYHLLAKIEIYDKNYFQNEFKEYPEELIKFFGKLGLIS